MIKNAISFDIEDWFCVNNMSGIIPKEEWSRCKLRVGENTLKILDLLDRHQTKGTFFILGWIAERIPELIKEIHKRGHEIGSHGYSHELITKMSPQIFEQDLKLSLKIIKDITGSEVIGFRAPSFTITKNTIWAIEILSRNKIKYDSSVFPIDFHPDYGIPNAELGIFRIGDNILEFPLSCVEIMGRRIPCSGGGYFRMYPYFLTKLFINNLLKTGRPYIFYLHPWEIDTQQPRIKLPFLKRIRHYINLEKTFCRLEKLLSDFEFTTIRRVLGL